MGRSRTTARVCVAHNAVTNSLWDYTLHLDSLESMAYPKGLWVSNGGFGYLGHGGGAYP